MVQLSLYQFNISLCVTAISFKTFLSQTYQKIIRFQRMINKNCKNRSYKHELAIFVIFKVNSSLYVGCIFIFKPCQHHDHKHQDVSTHLDFILIAYLRLYLLLRSVGWCKYHINRYEIYAKYLSHNVYMINLITFAGRICIDLCP